MDRQGEFDPFMQSWCATHLDHPMCACYVPIASSEGISQETLSILQANPQCWNSACTTTGYQPTNILGKPCPSIQLQQCIQEGNVSGNGGSTIGEVVFDQSIDCQQHQEGGFPPDSSSPGSPPGSPGSGEDPDDADKKKTNVFVWVLSGVGLILFIGTLIYLFKVKKKR